jgi:hypothetical protein
MRVLTCNDFIRCGFLEAESCCPYCHEADHNLYTNDFVVDNPYDRKVKAVLCCTTVSKISKLSELDWKYVVENIIKSENDIIS